jgi:hypothetical protein
MARNEICCLHWPKLDADLYAPALLQGIFGSRKWMTGHAARLSAGAETACGSDDPANCGGIRRDEAAPILNRRLW